MSEKPTEKDGIKTPSIKININNFNELIELREEKAKREVFDGLEKADLEHSHIYYKDIMESYKEIIKRERRKHLGDEE